MNCKKQTFQTLLTHSGRFQHRTIDQFMIEFESLNQSNLIERVEHPNNPMFHQTNPQPIVNQSYLPWTVYQNGNNPNFRAEMVRCQVFGLNFPTHGQIKAEPVIVLNYRYGRKVRVSARMRILDSREGRLMHEGTASDIVECFDGGIGQFEKAIFLDGVNNQHREAQAGHNVIVFDVLFQEVIEEDVQLCASLFNKALTF